MKPLLIQLVQPAFWFAILQIATINLLLSEDNVVAIALACRELPPGQRRLGTILGAGGAVLLTVFFASIVSILMLMPFLKLIWGVALLYIAWQLNTPGNPDPSANTDAADNLWKAAQMIAVTNVVMSFDNVVAIAAVAQGNVAVGLAISIPLVVASGSLLVALLNWFPILGWAGAGLLGWIAGDVIATDPALEANVKSWFGVVAAQKIDVAMASTGALFVVLAQWRRRRSTSRQSKAES